MEDTRGNLGTRIRRARERKGWTQTQLANAVGVGMRTIGNWERNENSPKNRLGRLEEVLGVDLSSPEPQPQVSRVHLGGEVEVLMAHYGELTALEKMRLAMLIRDAAFNEGVGGEEK